MDCKTIAFCACILQGKIYRSTTFAKRNEMLQKKILGRMSHACTQLVSFAYHQVFFRDCLKLINGQFVKSLRPLFLA